ncbi:MAG: Ig-like domain-containing protein [Bacteroidales bacterium]|nr:Ig-like domain-containing protein [Bacteroidales bacterium]
MKTSYLILALSIMLVCFGCKEEKNNTPPIISSIELDSTAVSPGGTINAQVLATDPDGDQLDYSYTVSEGNIVGFGANVQIIAPMESGIYNLNIVVSDGNGGEATGYEIFYVDSKPIINEITITPEVLQINSTAVIQVDAVDPDGDQLIYDYSPEAGTITGSGPTVTWNTPDYPGSFVIEISVSDSRDTVKTELTLSVINNAAPIITEIIINPDSVQSEGVATVTVTASDPDGDALTYLYTPSGGSISGFGSSVTWTAPYEGGTYSINVKVSDGNGGNATGSVSVVVHQAGVALENLVAHWLFNGDADDATANGHDGTLTMGHAYFGGGAAPQLVADRFGNANYCYHFDQGSNIEVPYSTALNPQSMTISLWIKMEGQAYDDYIISLNRWNGWKLNIQGNMLLFFTVRTLYNGNLTYYDRDSNPYAITAETWTHIAVSFTDGFMNFYINGELAQSWDNTPGIPVTVDNINLTIGSDLPTGVYTTVEGDFYIGWGGYFKGNIDDVRFYDKALTPPQVASIYNFEKDNAVEE